ncbi:SRPBCC domain-containing protein [Agromyces sp. MMS24-JH15]|uniref:SRPBCC domain-containing protein n=1 Tax=Agromyces sp. MMS24-JH15 TaxID=3243765 RepID=UPI0037480432
MGATATGHYAISGNELRLQFSRLFHAPIEEVWHTLTNPHAMSAWIGTWTGSPSTGAILFRMTAEDPDADWMSVSVLECEAPHRLRLHFGSGPETRRLHLHLTEGGGMTSLTFQERLTGTQDVTEVGPGWDYYFDRFTAARAGTPMPDWSDYYPLLADHYARLPVPRTEHSA